ncbi:MAG: outer membrane protein assembly factor BamE [Coxiella-like endosymbiont]|uniref:outer membrane protein assembly factor BamE n=1 Tax=Coxiella-like endosymbiont TaxID=1592897 RepID=UPI00215A1F71|nr:outer membrane protein assembly factor BamE [Coxiella-like endosymbiont]UVE59630.1 outer membrane protein assembly factor BamE [Coxiella-like endosymbiont]
MRRIITITSLIIYFLFTSTACVYHPSVQQGNIITDRELNTLHKGMSKSKVRSLLGDPILVNIYADDRLVYVYTFQAGRRKMQSLHLIIYLSNNRVTNFCTEKIKLQHR